jgi:hypothetical protein
LNVVFAVIPGSLSLEVVVCPKATCGARAMASALSALNLVVRLPARVDILNVFCIILLPAMVDNTF